MAFYGSNPSVMMRGKELQLVWKWISEGTKQKVKIDTIHNKKETQQLPGGM